MDLIKKAIYFGLGAVLLTEEKVKETLDDLVKKGELSKEDSKTMVKEVLERAKENKKIIEEKITEELEKFIKKANIATNSELQNLEKRIENLENLLKEKKILK